MPRRSAVPPEVLDRVAAVMAEVPDQTGPGRCDACLMLAHRQCAGRDQCSCTDEFHKSDGPAEQGGAVEERAASPAQKAG